MTFNNKITNKEDIKSFMKKLYIDDITKDDLLIYPVKDKDGVWYHRLYDKETFEELQSLRAMKKRFESLLYGK